MHRLVYAFVVRNPHPRRQGFLRQGPYIGLYREVINIFLSETLDIWYVASTSGAQVCSNYGPGGKQRSHPIGHIGLFRGKITFFKPQGRIVSLVEQVLSRG